MKKVDYFWLFVVSSFFGFVIEIIWCMIRWRKMEGRKGLIYGPFIPIYGLVGLIVAIILEILNVRKMYLAFLTTFIIGGFVEYFSSFFQEKITGTISWDYSDMRFNLHGRVNLTYLIGFGIFGIVWLIIYPKIIRIVHNFLGNDRLFSVLSILMFIFMIADMCISLVATVRWKLRRKGIQPKNRFEVWVDRKYTDNFLKKVYVNSMIVD